MATMSVAIDVEEFAWKSCWLRYGEEAISVDEYKQKLNTKYKILGILNLGLAQEVAGRLMEVVAQALDGRMKEAITGDANYQLLGT
jgi:hypothetical protein